MIRRDLHYWVELLFRRKNAFLETAAIIANPVNEQDLNSEVELLTSIHLIKQAIAGLPLPKDVAGSGFVQDTVGLALQLPNSGYRLLHASPAPDARDQWALKLARRLGVSVIKRSNIIEVDFRAHDARWAHDFLTMLLNQYQEYHAGLSHDPEAAQFFDQQAKQLNARLEDSENKLREFELKTGITSLSGQKQALVTRLSDLQIEEARDATALASAQQRVAALEQQLKTTPERIDKETRSVQNLALQQLKPQVMQLKAERAELLARYQPTSQRIQQIDAKIAAAERILEHEDHLEVQERSSDLNPVWVTIDTNLQDARVKAASLEASLNTMNSQIQSGHAALDQMVNDAIEMG